MARPVHYGGTGSLWETLWHCALCWQPLKPTSTHTHGCLCRCEVCAVQFILGPFSQHLFLQNSFKHDLTSFVFSHVYKSTTPELNYWVDIRLDEFLSPIQLNANVAPSGKKQFCWIGNSISMLSYRSISDLYSLLGPFYVYMSMFLHLQAFTYTLLFFLVPDLIYGAVVVL